MKGKGNTSNNKHLQNRFLWVCKIQTYQKYTRVKHVLSSLPPLTLIFISRWWSFTVWLTNLDWCLRQACFQFIKLIHVQIIVIVVIFVHFFWTLFSSITTSPACPCLCFFALCLRNKNSINMTWLVYWMMSVRKRERERERERELTFCSISSSSFSLSYSSKASASSTNKLAFDRNSSRPLTSHTQWISSAYQEQNNRKWWMVDLPHTVVLSSLGLRSSQTCISLSYLLPLPFHE